MPVVSSNKKNLQTETVPTFIYACMNHKKVDSLISLGIYVENLLWEKNTGWLLTPSHPTSNNKDISFWTIPKVSPRLPW